MSITVGPHQLPANVLLAPMSGITDAPFRRLASSYGAGLVVTEMIASSELASQSGAVLRRATIDDGAALGVVQLAGRETHWMAEGARIAEALGADIVDINMGCPAKQVTGSQSGSALMRNLDHALELIEATIGAVKVPVTLKMRLGWDDDTKNAPELAKRAVDAGVQMLTVHGRTRCQFYTGTSDWRFVRKVVEAVDVPVIVNGDVVDSVSLDGALEASGAVGVMIGRGAYGRPWLPGILARRSQGEHVVAPTLEQRGALVHSHYEDMLRHYGIEQGNRCARKHLGWYVDSIVDCGVHLQPHEARMWRKRFCQDDDHRSVLNSIVAFHNEQTLHCEAA